MEYKSFVGREYVCGEWQYTTLETGCSYSLGDFENYRGKVTEALYKNLFILPELLSGSDYSGGIIERSNHQSFMRLFGKVDGVYNIYGGYGTFGIAIRLDTYNSNDEIKEAIDGLENYALLDEEDYSEMENKYDRELVSETAKDLSRIITLENYIPDIDTILEDIEMLENLIWEAVSECNLIFEHENYSSYIRDDNKIKNYVEDRLMLEYCKKLPIMINREWVCEQNKQRYLNKLSGVTNE